MAFQEASFAYPEYGNSEGPKALDSVTVQFPVGLRTVILGHNGSGKSTLLLHGNGILKPGSGTVYFAGKPMQYTRKALLSLRQQVGVLFQHSDDQLFGATVAQEISFGPLNLGLDEATVRQRVADAARQCDITHRLDKPTHALSGGEKARAALAGVLAMEPELLLIDEPTASLDPPMRKRFFAIFQELHSAGKTIVLATHELEIARR